jgi:hypothetical protein
MCVGLPLARLSDLRHHLGHAAERYSSRDGWAVEVVELTETPNDHHGAWILYWQELCPRYACIAGPGTSD